MTVLTHRRPRKIAAAVLLTALFAAGFAAVAQTIVSAHKATVVVTDSTCSETGGWSFDLSISSDVPGGSSTISAFSSPYTISLPYGPVPIHVAADQDHYTFTVRTVWPDGFQSPAKELPPMGYTAHRPESGCVPPTTTVTTPETAPATSIAPIPTTVPVVPTTATPPTSTAPPTSATVPATLPGGGESAVTTTPARSLPATGSNDTAILLTGVAALLIGGALLLAGRRGSAA